MCNANPGLARRFQLDQAWNFDDFDDDTLYYILKEKAKTKGLTLNYRTLEAGVDVLSKQRLKPNFGNGGAMCFPAHMGVSSADVRELSALVGPR